IVRREGDQQRGPEVRLCTFDPHRVWIDEEPRDVPQAADRGIHRDAVLVVEVEADAEAVRVRQPDAGQEQRHDTDGELAPGRKRHRRTLNTIDRAAERGSRRALRRSGWRLRHTWKEGLDDPRLV